MAELEKRKFDVAAFLASAGLGRRIIQLVPKETFFSQGDPADSIFYLQEGRAKVTVVSTGGKEANHSAFLYIHEMSPCFFHFVIFGSRWSSKKSSKVITFAAAAYCQTLSFSPDGTIMWILAAFISLICASETFSSIVAK